VNQWLACSLQQSSVSFGALFTPTFPPKFYLYFMNETAYQYAVKKGLLVLTGSHTAKIITGSVQASRP
jgi:hypothetical protein